MRPEAYIPLTGTETPREARMPVVEIYTTPMCPYCSRAKRLLRARGVPFTEIDLWKEPQRRAEMIARAGGRTTVPQIFVDGRHVGGCDDLHELEARGELDALLAEAGREGGP